MKYFRSKLEAAGLSRFTTGQVLVLGFSVATALASWIHISFGVLGLTGFCFLAVLGLGIESLNAKAKIRSEQISKVWPEVLDSLQSAASSGYGLVESLNEISIKGPESLRPLFRGLIERIDLGLGMDESLDWLKAQFGNLQGDRLVELIRVVHRSGGLGFRACLRDQADRTRSEIALWGELESKQGWVTGTAKLAIIAPWIIVAILSSRPENVEIYNTNEGVTILIIGLVISLVAYRLVSVLGTLPKPRRVLAN